MKFKTYSQKSTEVDHKWILVDAKDAPLGRLATFVAQRLSGKYKPTFTPHIDDGDYVVIINAGEVAVTGNKELDKKYHRHSGFPGGITTQSLAEMRAKHPERIIEEAVRGMIPKNKLSSERMKRLRVFTGAEHSHAAQNPEKVEVK